MKPRNVHIFSYFPKSEAIATTIVEDILKTVENYFIITLPVEKLATGEELREERLLKYGHLVWMAVSISAFF